MKPFFYILLLIVTITSCEKRNCTCQDDLQFSWVDNNELENVVVSVPNAVLNVGHPLAISVSGINKNILWKLQYVKIHNDESIFVESEISGKFRKNDITIEFPHELLSDSFTGPLSIKMDLIFQEKRALLQIEGTIFYYSCEDIGEDFNLEECRWPEQISGHVIVDPC